VFDADYNMLECSLDEVHEKVLKVHTGSPVANSPPEGMTADLTWLLIGANARTIGWNERQILQVDFAVWNLSCWSIEAQTLSVKGVRHLLHSGNQRSNHAFQPKVGLRQEAEQVCEALELISTPGYRQRVVVGVFKKLMQHISAGELPYGVCLGYIMCFQCAVNVHEQHVGGRKVTYILPTDDMSSVAGRGAH